ncbi:MAG: dihydropteroate synthase [Spirochaetaceae bacterium]|nr:dihydropteroate synthase [Spirochaetaceae bacterium]
MSPASLTRVMGILNCTPDSFYAKSRRGNFESAWNAARSMIRQGVDIIDVGGESSRPGSRGIEPEEQILRTVPVIRAIREHTDIPVSIDTTNSKVAEAALDAGADIINDISALQGDADMCPLAAERQVPIILMHMKGTPATMQMNPRYLDAVTEIREELMRSVNSALDQGIRQENIILDPGIGFGKRLQDNLDILARLDEWRPEGYPILVGLSRKSFLGKLMNAENERAVDSYSRAVRELAGDPPHEIPSEDSPDNRLVATIAANAWCLTKGVDILRVHDVLETRQLLAVWEALL